MTHDDQNPGSRRGHRDTLALYLDRTFGPLPDARQVGSADFPLAFRPLTADLLDQKAWVHSRTWRQTYDGLLPGPLLSLVSPDFAKNVTRRHGFSHTLLAMAGRRVIGYAEWVDAPRPPFVDPAAGPVDPDDGSGEGPRHDGPVDRPVDPPVELAAIYLLEQYQHLGIGTRLFEAVKAAAGSPRRLMLWVLATNSAAQRFYHHLGFRPAGQIQSEDGGQLIDQAWLLDR